MAIFKWVKRFLLFVGLLAVLTVGLWVFFDNDVSVDLALFGFQFSGVSLGIVICLVFVSGLTIGLATSYMLLGGRLIAEKRKYGSSQKVLSQYREQVSSK